MGVQRLVSLTFELSEDGHNTWRFSTWTQPAGWVHWEEGAWELDTNLLTQAAWASEFYRLSLEAMEKSTADE